MPIKALLGYAFGNSFAAPVLRKQLPSNSNKKVPVATISPWRDNRGQGIRGHFWKSKRHENCSYKINEAHTAPDFVPKRGLSSAG